MQFAFIGGLWFALSLPFIVLLYLLKRRYTDTEVSSHLLWRRVLREQEANRPWQRLRRQLLLWLQLLAALLLVLALMQPFIWQNNVAKDHVVFVLDASASMHAEEAGTTRLEQAKTQILQYADEQAAKSDYSLLIMRDQPELLLRKESSASVLEAILDKVEPFFGRTEYKQAISLAASLTREDSNTELRIYTDKQWTEPASDIPFSVPVTFVDVANNPLLNHVSILQFGVNSNASSAVIRASATIKNWGQQPVSFEAAVYAVTSLTEVRQLSLNANEQKTFYFENLPSVEFYKLQLDLNDRFSEDQTSFAFLQGGGRKLAALLGSGSLFLEKALAVADIDVVRIQKSPDGSYPPPAGSSLDLLILDGVDPAGLVEPAWNKLLRSKPIWQFTSAATADNSNSATSNQANRESVEVQAANPPFIMADHPVTRYLTFQDSHFAAVKKLSPPDWGKPIVTAGEVPLVYAGSNQGISRLLFAFQLQQTDLPLRSEFPVLIQNSVEWLLKQQGGNLGRALAGEKKELPLSPEAERASWQRIEPIGEEFPAEFDDKSLNSIQTIPSMPGLYRFVETNMKGELVKSRYMEVAIDPRESNLNAKIETSIETDASVVKMEGIRKEKGDLSMISLIPWVTSLLMLLLLLEWEVYRRGHSV
jgi:hypothetical protein